MHDHVNSDFQETAMNPTSPHPDFQAIYAVPGIFATTATKARAATLSLTTTA
jgi:hypothetical protein